MKIMILGASGMLGNALFRLFSSQVDFQAVGTIRAAHSKILFSDGLDKNLICGIDVENTDHLIRIIEMEKPDVVINCIGLVKQHSESSDPLASIPINSLLPHRIALICSMSGARFIHFSTDCVFSGNKGFYKESDEADARDLYGVSKFMGEVSGNYALTLRTSIIGHELQGCKSLINWFLSQQSSCEGFRQAYFSGMPTVEIGKVLLKYVLPNPGLSGIYHVSTDKISKYDLLKTVARIYGKNIKIIPNDTFKIDRSLDSSKFRAETGFVPKSWEELVMEMYEFH